MKDSSRKISRSDRSRSARRVNAQESKSEKMEILRLQSLVDRLKSDLVFEQRRAQEVQFSAKSISKSDDLRTSEKKLEAEKSKNFYLENENMRLQQQVRELNSKYKMFIDEKNRHAVETYVSQRKVSTNSHTLENKGLIFDLKRQNKTLKEKVNSMSNELKMNKNITDAIASIESELQSLKSQHHQ